MDAVAGLAGRQGGGLPGAAARAPTDAIATGIRDCSPGEGRAANADASRGGEARVLGEGASVSAEQPQRQDEEVERAFSGVGK